MDGSRPTSRQVLERVQLILRRDLKLGADAKVPPDMPFFGGDVDLDSLDILLLVTSIEKELGVKIPSNEVGKQVFQNVGTLVRYVEENLGQASSAASPTSASVSSDELLKQLPHAAPFRFVTRVMSVAPGESAEGAWSVTGAEDFFRGHFPGNPLVPGVLVAEALAQIAGLAGATGAARGGMLAHVDVRFERPVVPPAEIILRAKLARTLGTLQQFDVVASVGNDTVASGSIALHRPPEGS